MSKDTLKPCPFCGGTAKVKSQPVAQNKSQYAVQCKCGARFYFMDRKYKAINAWNQRVNPSERSNE